MFETILIGLIGLLLGIFVNYLADVLPIKRRLSKPICRHCHETQNYTRYFLAPRSCHQCGRFRGLRTVFVEIIFIVLAVWLFSSSENNIDYMWRLLLSLYFLLVLVIDLEYKLIMHPVSIFGAVLGLIYGWVSHGLLDTLLGALAGFGLMYLLFLFGGMFTKFLSRRRGEPIEEIALGFGDVILATVLGLMLGWPGIFVGILLAIILGGIVSLFYIVVMVILRKYKAFEAIPYGPFLVTSAFLLLFAKEFLYKIM